MIKKTAIIAALLLALSPVSASAPLDVSVNDVAAAGYAGAQAVEPVEDRFQPPVRYFRVDQTLSAADAKRDCPDCRNLVAIFVGPAGAAPDWSNPNINPVRRVGGRTQVRKYLAASKTVIIVTAPDREKAIVLSNALVKKFSP